MRLTLIVLMLFIASRAFSQKDTTFVREEKLITIEKDESKVFSYYSIDIKPFFKKAKNKEESEVLFKDYIKKQIEERRIDQKGEVYVNMLISEEGVIEACKIIRSSNEELDKHAIEIVINSPTWSSGINKGKKVKVSYNTVVKFE